MTAMEIPDIFSRAAVDALKTRIQRLSPDTRPQWGRMNAAQMLAHASKPYDTLFDADYQRRHPPHTGLMRLLLKWLVKPLVVGSRPYKPNTRTAPSYVVADERDLVRERDKLFGYLDRVQAEGRAGFEGRLSYSFGPLTAAEWNVLFYKHLDHHLRQFGV